MLLFIHPKWRTKGRLRTAFSRLSLWLQELTRAHLLRWAILAVMVFTLLGGDRGLISLIPLLHDRATLKKDIQELIARRTQLTTDLHHYTSDPATVEKIVRERLDMVKRGETVYKFPSR